MKCGIQGGIQNKNKQTTTKKKRAAYQVKLKKKKENLNKIQTTHRVIYHYWFINCDKYTILMKNDDNQGNWCRAHGNNSVLYSQFFCKSKSVLKYKVD